MRIIKKLGWQAPGGGHDQAYPHAKVSPGGKFVAYDYPSANERTRDIYAVAIDGKREIMLVSGHGSDRLLGWIPDGSGILFYSDRNKSPSVWRQRVRDDQPIGKPELIRSGVRDLIPMGFTHDGYAYGLPLEAEHVYTGAVDTVRGLVIEPPRPIPDLPTRKILTADWSPDGRRLLYATQGAFPDPVETLVIRTADGKPTRTIPLSNGLHTSSGTLRWIAPEIVFVAGYAKGLEGIYEVNLRRATFRRLPTPATIGWGAMKWFDIGPGGHTIYMIQSTRQSDRENNVLALDVASGEVRVIGTARADPNSLAVSPDGKKLAYLVRDNARRMIELQVSSVAGAHETRIVYAAPLGKIRPPIVWTPDGSRLLFEVHDKEDSALWSVAERGGAPKFVLPRCCGGNDIRINRDGRRIAFLAGSDRSEVWVMKGF
jgi:Tol biopolymer transport system component